MEESLLSDEELVEQLRDGSETAFEILYKRYFNKLVDIANRRLRDRFQAEELTQDIFANLWQKRHTIQIHTSMAAYLSTAMRYAVLDFIRHAKVKTEYVQEILSVADATETTTDNIVHARDLSEKITHQIGSLPDKCRQVFLLSRFEGKTNREIAAVLNISVDTIKYHIAHALQELRSGIKELR